MQLFQNWTEKHLHICTKCKRQEFHKAVKFDRIQVHCVPKIGGPSLVCLNVKMAEISQNLCGKYFWPRCMFSLSAGTEQISWKFFQPINWSTNNRVHLSEVVRLIRVHRNLIWSCVLMVQMYLSDYWHVSPSLHCKMYFCDVQSLQLSTSQKHILCCDGTGVLVLWLLPCQ